MLIEKKFEFHEQLTDHENRNIRLMKKIKKLSYVVSLYEKNIKEFNKNAKY